MAASLNRPLMAGMLLCMALPALALELLPDPTKPAAEVSVPAAAGSGSGVSAVAAAASVQTSSQGGVQSVILSPQRRAAVINGQTVELGGKVGDATLVEVRESSVVLQGAQGKRVMELFPGVRLLKTEPVLLKAKEEKPRQIVLKKIKKKNNKKKQTSGVMDPGKCKDERVSQ